MARGEGGPVGTGRIHGPDLAVDDRSDKSGVRPTGKVAEGVKMTRQMFLSMLDKYGVKPTAVLGQPFDPEHHEALGIVEDSEIPPGSVAAVEQPGYTYQDKLLRPARVLVTPEE